MNAGEHISSTYLTNFEKINVVIAHAKRLLLQKYTPTIEEEEIGLMSTAENHLDEKKILDFTVVRKFVGFSDTGEILTESVKC